MQTLKPTKKQKILTEAVKKLDSNFELVVIDNELCLYKRSADDKFDVEVSGTIGYIERKIYSSGELIEDCQRVISGVRQRGTKD